MIESEVLDCGYGRIWASGLCVNKGRVLYGMKFSDKVEAIVKSEEFSEEVKDFTENLISAAAGDIVATAKAMKFIILSPMFFRECLFWEKFIMFMDGVFLEDDDITKLSEIFAGNDEKESYTRRIIKVIDDIDVKLKITYIINLTRSLLSGFIIKPDYYRLVYVIKDLLIEDLQYFAKTINEKDLIANIHIEFLKQNGLVIQSEISSYEDISENKYIFTPLAIMLDMYGVNYDNGKYEYSILTNNLSEQPVPVTRMGKIITRFA